MYIFTIQEQANRSVSGDVLHTIKINGMTHKEDLVYNIALTEVYTLVCTDYKNVEIFSINESFVDGTISARFSLAQFKQYINTYNEGLA